MRWKNKGHEFDEVGERFKDLERIYIYGTGQFGTEAAVLLKGIGADIAFIDQIKTEQKTYMGVSVFTPEQFEAENLHAIVVLAMGRDNAGIVLKQLELKGYQYGVTVFDINSFMSFYIYIIALYRYQKCVMVDCSVMATWQCSLRCKNCMGAFPYIKQPQRVNFSEWKKDVDILFANIDYVLEFGIAGGEMLLCNNLEQYIDYVMSNYAHQIGNCTFLTNGTILPNEKIIEVLQKYHMHVVVSNYSEVRHWKERFNKLEQLMNENGIPISTIDYESWIDMGWTEKKHKDEVDTLFDTCGMQCRVVREGRLNYCVHGMTANEALYHLDLIDDEFDLTAEMDRKKYQLVEYHLGFNERGNLKMCHYCNGYVNINEKTVPVAIQLTTEEYLQIQGKDRR